MVLDERILRLIAIGASIPANCQPCLETNVAKALELGASETEVAEAIWVGSQVRRGAAAGMDRFASAVIHQAPPPVKMAHGSCECS